MVFGGALVLLLLLLLLVVVVVVVVPGFIEVRAKDQLYDAHQVLAIPTSNISHKLTVISKIGKLATRMCVPSYCSISLYMSCDYYPY